MAPRGSHLITALSGGADSVCLLLILKKLSGILGISLSAMHVNHGLRGGEADRDEAFCHALCGRLEVECRSAAADVKGAASRNGQSLEEAARAERYRLLFEERDRILRMRGAGEVFIACAHHADDQAETVLLNLFRGSGLRGLSGMRPVRGCIVRPLLAVSRSDILRYLGERGQDYVTDSTNLENDATRNYLRNILIPELEEKVNRRAAEHTVLSAGFCRQADEYLTQEAKRFAEAHFTTEENACGDGTEKRVKLAQQILKEKPQILRRYVIIEALQLLGVPLKDWSEKHLSDIDGALSAQSGFHLDLPCGVKLENRYRESVLFRTEDSA